MSALNERDVGSCQDIVIIGSGFAAQQLVKSLRKLDGERPIRLITADNGNEYNKPDLSHVVSRGYTANAITKLTGAQFAEQQRIILSPNTVVHSISPTKQIVHTDHGDFSYGQLVLATGASSIRPSMPNSDQMVTLNSQNDYANAEQLIKNAKRIMVLGAGLIGCELAMDMVGQDRIVTLVDLADSPLSTLMPAALSQPLLQALREQGVDLKLGRGIKSIQRGDANESFTIELTDSSFSEQDLVISAIGLQPSLSLAMNAGLTVRRGIVVDDYLRTSSEHIYALGDCVEWKGELRPFLQPIVLGANALSKTLIGKPTPLTLPPMLVKVKTLQYPLQLAGRTQGADLSWQFRWNKNGMVAEARSEDGEMCGFVVGGDQMGAAFPLLRLLSR
ncbi:NADH:flavorubredoxin reductase NorW [Aeromonas veronii]